MIPGLLARKLLCKFGYRKLFDSHSHNFIFENSFIHQLDVAVFIPVNNRFEIHLIKNLCLKINARSDFHQMNAVLFQCKYGTFCDIKNIFTLLTSDNTGECDFCYFIDELMLSSFLNDR